MTRTRIAIAFAGALLAAFIAVPATASALEPSDALLASLSEAPEIEWQSMTPVAQYIAQKNAAAAAASAKSARGKSGRVAAKSVPTVTEGTEERWTTAQLDAVASEALAAWGIPTEEWAWVLEANRVVAFRESGNRPGAIGASGKYQGMHQWSPSWAGTERLDGTWSVKRFVEVYAKGGKAKIRQHWKATIGNL